MSPADLMTKPLPGQKVALLMKTMGYEFVGQSPRQLGKHCLRLVGGLTDVKVKAKSLAAATAKRHLRKFTVVQLALIRKAELGRCCKELRRHS